MNMKKATLLVTILLLMLACNLPISASSPTLPDASPPAQAAALDPTSTPLLPTETAIVELASPTFEAQAATVEPVSTTAQPNPTCTVLQDLNLRTGPGTAYRPPIRSLPVNSVVTPLGFNPTGIPGGSWAYIEDPASQQKGWVSAGNQYISCDLDLASLPSIEVGTPPPPPLPNSAISSTPEGSCRDEGIEYGCEVVVSKGAWIQFKILKDGQELGQKDGVENVSFDVIDRDGQTVYSIIEKSKDYCIFGGGGPCNPWIEENFQYKWKAGGEPVKPGEYLVNIQATVNGTTLTWRANFTIALP